MTYLDIGTETKTANMFQIVSLVIIIILFEKPQLTKLLTQVSVESHHDPIIFPLFHGMAYTPYTGLHSVMYVPLEAGLDQGKLEYSPIDLQVFGIIFG